MKAKTLRLLAGTAVPLILTGSVEAGFLGISTTSKPNDFGLLVVNVYAEFDRPGEDALFVVGGSALTPMLIEVIGGTFYNHTFGSDRPPGTALINAFPILAFDSFVTIGVKSVGVNGQPADNLRFAPGFPGVSGTSIDTDASSWGAAPGSPQTDPFNPDYFAGDGRVLLGQFSTANGTAIQGTMAIHAASNGVTRQHAVSFYHVPGPGALWLLGATGLLGTRRRR